MKKVKEIFLAEAFHKFIIASRTGTRRLANGRKIGKGTVTGYSMCFKLINDLSSNRESGMLFIPV